MEKIIDFIAKKRYDVLDLLIIIFAIELIKSWTI